MRWFYIAGLMLGLGQIAGCTEPVEGPQQSAVETAIENPYFTVSVAGTGPDIILMPGLASSAAVWDDTVAALDEKFTLHTIQVSGFGGAPARGNADNDDVLDDLAAALVSYASSLDQPPAVVGHSLGGLVTLKAALQPEARFEQIVIIDVLPFFSVLMDGAATVESIAPVAAFMKATLLGQSDDVFALRQAEALAALVQGEENRALALDWSVTSDRTVMAQAMSEVLITDLRPDISAIGIPTTVIYAKDDDIPNMASVEAFYHDLYAPLPDGNLVAVEDAFHFVMLDQPVAFVAALEAALEP